MTVQQHRDDDDTVAARQEMQARRTRELTELFNDRQELRGVHAMADLVGEQATWCA